MIILVSLPNTFFSCTALLVILLLNYSVCPFKISFFTFILSFCTCLPQHASATPWVQWAIGVTSPQDSVCVEKESQDRGVTAVLLGISKVTPPSGHVSVSIAACTTHFDYILYNN